jgi:hypothetical protein
MSKFIERLKQVTQPVPQQMGFRPNNSAQQRPRLQLIVRVEGKITDDKLTPADAAVFTDGQISQTGIVKGVYLKNTDNLETIIKAGTDFVMMPADSQVIHADKKIGKILEISVATTDILLRTIGDLPVDAVVMAEDGSNLTWQKLMHFQRFAVLIDKPVIVPVTTDLTEEELQSIWETGVSGVMIKITKEAEAENLLSLRKNIDKLKFPVRRKKDKFQATLPKISASAEEPDEDEEDE